MDIDYIKSQISQLEATLNDFIRAEPKFRKTMISRVELQISNIKQCLSYPYASTKCTSLLESCKKLTHLRQPKKFREEPHKSAILGDLSVIKSHIKELE